MLRFLSFGVAPFVVGVVDKKGDKDSYYFNHREHRVYFDTFKKLILQYYKYQLFISFRILI
jgi:hypothetical protein